jgi:hypothetical protein
LDGPRGEGLLCCGEVLGSELALVELLLLLMSSLDRITVLMIIFCRSLLSAQVVVSEWQSLPASMQVSGSSVEIKLIFS